MNKSTLYKFIIFLAINFSGLYLGSLFTSDAVISEWYLKLNKSSITPPGWFFGFAWTTIMICFAFYMTWAHNAVQNKKKLIIIYAIQWLLNFIWSPIFFNLHLIGIGLIIIFSLTLGIIFIALHYYKTLKSKSILLLPYVSWLCVATFLNLYIYINN